MRTMQDVILGVLYDLIIEQNMEPVQTLTHSNSGNLYCQRDGTCVLTFHFDFQPRYVTIKNMSGDQIAYAEFHDNAGMAKLYAMLSQALSEAV